MPPLPRSALAALLALALPAPLAAENALRLEAGTLVCTSSGGWSAVIVSKDEFDCTFDNITGSVRDRYTGEIQNFGLDIGVSGDTKLTWVVLGPESGVGDLFVPGSLAGKYFGVGAEASAGVGVGANALVGGGDNSFALQPLSLQLQTGINVAAGIKTLELFYAGPQ